MITRFPQSRLPLLTSPRSTRNDSGFCARNLRQIRPLFGFLSRWSISWFSYFFCFAAFCLSRQPHHPSFETSLVLSLKSNLWILPDFLMKGQEFDDEVQFLRLVFARKDSWLQFLSTILNCKEIFKTYNHKVLKNNWFLHILKEIHWIFNTMTNNLSFFM